jgi:probable phosphoglycerate mutase
VSVLDASPSRGALPPLLEAKRVVLVRHGQSTWNAEGRIQGSSDLSVLTPKGESQAETSRLMLLSDTFDACFISPLARSRRTAEIIWDSRDKDLIPDYDLREIDLYSFQVCYLLARCLHKCVAPGRCLWKCRTDELMILVHRDS